MEHHMIGLVTGEKYSLHGFIDDATGKITGLYMCKKWMLIRIFRSIKTNIGKLWYSNIIISRQI